MKHNKSLMKNRSNTTVVFPLLGIGSTQPMQLKQVFLHVATFLMCSKMMKEDNLTTV